MAPRPVRFRVVPQEEGTAIGSLVGQRLPNMGKKEGVALVKAGAVYIGHLRVRVPSTRVATGDRITVYPDALADEELDPHAVVQFVHRDPAFVVLDKPAGVPVAATKASARGTLSEALRRVLRDEGIERPYVGVVHRLDQGASGLVLFTVRGVANQSVHRNFVDHSIERTYRVRVHGDAPDAFTCDLPLIDKPGTDSMQVARSGERRAKEARTEFRRIPEAEPISGTSLLEVALDTGRTHQIRVHAAESGHPVCGDRRYGPDETDASRLCLHAWRLAFEHPLEAGTAIELTTMLEGWARAADDA
ncbi:MAG: RluA family pseudouridine synthase [Myxococcota bacterium]